MAKKIILMNKPNKYSYNEISLAKPRINKWWLFACSGLLSPLVGIVAGHFVATDWALGIVISYSFMWGLASLIAVIGCCDKNIEFLNNKPNTNDLLHDCRELLIQNEELQKENDKLMEIIDPLLLEGGKNV